MNYVVLAPALLVTLSLSACDRPTVVTVPTPTVAVPGPYGPTGATGKAGVGTTVILAPPGSGTGNE